MDSFVIDSKQRGITGRLLILVLVTLDFIQHTHTHTHTHTFFFPKSTRGSAVIKLGIHSAEEVLYLTNFLYGELPVNNA